MTKLVSIDELTLDADVNIRTDLDEETVLRYMQLLDALPPIRVVQTKDALILTDGFHRTEAAARLGRTELFAEVRKGTRADAIEEASLANFQHGLPLTDEELEEALWRLNQAPPNGPGLSQVQIATRTGYSRHWVKLRLSRHLARMRGLGNLTADQAEAVNRLPDDVAPAVANAARNENWTVDQTTDVVRQVLANPKAVKSIIADAAPHLRAMSERLRYVRIMDAALNSIRQLDQVGVTPARLAGLVDDPAMAERWLRDLSTAEKYIADLNRKFKRGPQKLRAVEGGKTR